MPAAVRAVRVACSSVAATSLDGRRLRSGRGWLPVGIRALRALAGSTRSPLLSPAASAPIHAAFAGAPRAAVNQEDLCSFI